MAPIPTEMHDRAVVVEDLVIRYGQTTAVDGASFRAAAGEVTVLLGPNGAGKTSTVEHLEGYRTARSGRSSVLGLDPLRDRRQLSAHVGIMLQNGGIPMAIRPLDALRQYAGFFDDPIDPVELLDRVGLTGQRGTTYRKLSGGQRQRLSLGLAIIGRPSVVFLDEPSAGVDLAGRDSINEIITELRDRGACVVVTTHDLAEAEQLADRVVIMDHGRVVADATLADLLSDHGDGGIVFTTAEVPDLEGLAARIGSEVIRLSTRDYRVRAGSGTARDRTLMMATIAEACAATGVDLLDIRVGGSRLDDLFRTLTTGTGVPDDDAVEHA